MHLNNLRLINKSEPVNIIIHGEKIAAIENQKIASNNHFKIYFDNAIAFPGLINSHDHLDFNNFSLLGQNHYNNYTEWGNYIHEAYQSNINAVLKIPQQLRTAWGIYKNLLAGVTTVVNHGEPLLIKNPLINVHQAVQNLHSVKFQKNWKWKLNNPFLKDKTCVMHAGEGCDKQSADEIDELIKWNLLNRKLVAVHGVAMRQHQAKKFEALIWCPESNKILLNKHAEISALKEKIKIVFGTDSTLTGNWNIWHHIQLARSLHLVSDKELFGMLTTAPAQLWKLNAGELAIGKDADIVIAKKEMPVVSISDLLSINPADVIMVVQKGKIRLFDESLVLQINNLPVSLPQFSKININGTTKYIEGDLPALLGAIRSYHPEANIPKEIAVPAEIPVYD